MTEAEIRKEIIGLRKQWQEKGKNPMVWNDGKPFINNEFIEDLVALFKSERERLVREVGGIMKITIKEILNNHGIGGKLEENTTKDLEVLFKSERERLARDVEDRLDEAIYNNMDISGIREDVLKIIQVNKGEGVREVKR